MQQHGFSYVEIIFAIAILAVMATAVMPYAELAVIRKKEADLNGSLRQIRSAIDDYKQAVEDKRITKDADETPYPKTLLELVQGVDDASSPDKRQIYFLRRLPRDPMFDDVTVPAEQTWGLRSYTSPPDAPEAGDDVFDVFSFSEEVGLNGIPYNKW
jgi:general secretion pathway protein G